MKLYWQADYAGRKPELLAFFTKKRKNFFQCCKSCYTGMLHYRHQAEEGGHHA